MSMRIARFETFLVPPRWLFLRIETDDGVVGWGEPVVEGRAATVQAAVHELMEGLIGAEDFAQGGHLHVQRGFLNHHLRPHAVEQFVLRDEMSSAIDERGQQIEGARAQ